MNKQQLKFKFHLIRYTENYLIMNHFVISNYMYELTFNIQNIIVISYYILYFNIIICWNTLICVQYNSMYIQARSQKIFTRWAPYLNILAWRGGL